MIIISHWNLTAPGVKKADYYVTLELQRTATPAEIKKAYRLLAMRFHPDKNPGDVAMENKVLILLRLQRWSCLSNMECPKRRNVIYWTINTALFDIISQFKAISEAYQVLSDPNLKDKYDRYGHLDDATPQGGFAAATDMFNEIFGGDR